MPTKMFPKGRYYGYIAPEGSMVKVPTTLDLYIAQESSEYVKLKGILKFSLESFGSHEYASYYYDDIHYSWVEGKIILNLDDREIQVNDLSFHSKTGTMKGEVSLISVEKKGHLELVHESMIRPDSLNISELIFPHRTIAPLVTGEYTGRCQGKESVIQVETSKWDMRQNESTNFLNGYLIRGRQASKEKNLCKLGEAFCVNSVYHTGVFDAFSSRLILHGRPTSVTCEVDSKGLLCGGCRYIKSKNLFEAKPEITQQVVLPALPGSDLSDFPSDEELSGDFTGVLSYHGRLQKQSLKIRVNSYRYQDRPHRPELPYIAVNAWLDFESDTPTQKNSMAIDFINRRFLSTIPNLLIEGNHGFEFLIEKWTTEGIVGTVYSRQYGLIGSFQVLRNNSSSNHFDEIYPGISGRYRSRNWDLNLEFLGETGEVSDTNIFPVTVKGFLQRRGLSSKYFIERFSYDLFTGNIAIDISDNRIIYLFQNQDGSFGSHIPAIEVWGSVLKSYSGNGHSNLFVKSMANRKGR